MTDTKWVDAPPELLRGKPRAWVERLRPLMKRPGEWAMVGSHHCTAAASLKIGRYAVPEGRWEFTSRKNGVPRRADIYARYLGPEEE